MLQLNVQPISHLNAERGADEILNALFKTFFNGQPHKTNIADQTFPLVDVLINQANIKPPQDLPQIHIVLTSYKPVELWFASSNLSPWAYEIAQPASGINYGYADGHVEEAVAGKLCRRIQGTSIRWRPDDTALYEETEINGTWFINRTFTGATNIRWARISPTVFEEQIQTTEGWETIRQINSMSSWDGSKKFINAPTTFSIFVRVRNEGAVDDKLDHLCRSVADNVKTLFQSQDVRAALASKGMRHTRILSGPTPMESRGMRLRHMVLDTRIMYLQPILA